MRILFTIFGLLLMGSAFAGDFVLQSSATITAPVYGDLYVTAGKVIVNAPVHGDLIIAGGNVEVNDSIDNDLTVIGGSVRVNGVVGDDLRSFAGNLEITGKVTGDVVASGGKVVISSSASLGTLTVANGNVSLDGTVNGHIKSVSGNFVLNGAAKNSVDLRGDKIVINGSIGGKAMLAASKEILVSGSARIAGSTHYWLPLDHALQFGKQVSSFTPIYDPLLSITRERWYLLGASTFVGLVWYLGMAALVIVIMNFLFRKWFENAARTAQVLPMRSFGVGALTFIAVPLAVLLLAISIIGVPLAILLTALMVSVFMISTSITALVAGHWVEKVLGKRWSFYQQSGVAMFVFCLLKIVLFTPFFGPALSFGITLIAIGALVLNIRREARDINQLNTLEDAGRSFSPFKVSTP